jgi:hypothetical protein
LVELKIIIKCAVPLLRWSEDVIKE